MAAGLGATGSPDLVSWSMSTAAQISPAVNPLRFDESGKRNSVNARGTWQVDKYTAPAEALYTVDVSLSTALRPAAPSTVSATLQAVGAGGPLAQQVWASTVSNDTTFSLRLHWT